MLDNDFAGGCCRERVQKLEGEVASLRSVAKRLKTAEAGWAEAEARAAAHAGVEEALRYQLSHLQNAVKVARSAAPPHSPSASAQALQVTCEGLHN